MSWQDVVIWPGDFLPIEEQDSKAIIIGSFDKKEIKSTLCQKISEILERPREKSPTECPETGEEIYIKTIKIEDLFSKRPYYLALVSLGEEFNTDDFTPPLESRSKEHGSQAIYYAAHEEEGLLLQGLPAYCKTSSHDHEPVGWFERINILEGKVKLRTREGQHRSTYQLTRASPIGPIMGPQTVHRLSTEGQPLLNLIEIKGDRRWFERWRNRRGHRFQPL